MNLKDLKIKEILSVTFETVEPGDKIEMKPSEYKRVSKEEFINFINNYPRKLERDTYMVCEPPLITYNDFSTGKKWPESTVAKYWYYDENPEDHYYCAPEEREFYILK